MVDDPLNSDPWLSDPFLAQGLRRGWIVPPSQGKGTLPTRQPVAKMAEILAELDQDRSDR
jgi:hypothetical protein